MHWKPTECKHHHNVDEHSDEFFLGDFPFSLVYMYFIIRRHFVKPQFSRNCNIEDGDDGETPEGR